MQRAGSGPPVHTQGQAKEIGMDENTPAASFTPPEDWNIKHGVQPDPEAVEYFYQYLKAHWSHEQQVIDVKRQCVDDYNDAILRGDRKMAKLYRQGAVDRQAALDRFWLERNAERKCQNESHNDRQNED